MKRKLRNTILIGGAILGLLILVYPFLSSMAQKSPNKKNEKNQDQKNALQVVEQNLVANLFYDALQAQENDWTLIKAGSISGPPIAERVRGHATWIVNLILEKGKSEAQVGISEYPSEDEARFPLELQISQGVIEYCKGEECGDEGQKITSVYSKGFGLRFRKGRFFVTISCDSEEAAKRFAGYALSAVTNR